MYHLLRVTFSAALVAVLVEASAVPAHASVSFVGVPSTAANGDYNNDGVVNAADYTDWRNSLGGGAALPNDNGLGTPIGTGHYDLWRGNYGATGGGGNLFAFEDPANWSVTQYDPIPSVGLEMTPPGPTSIWFAEGNAEDVVLVLTDERTGENGTLEMGTFAYGGDTGGNDQNTKFTFVLNNSVTLRGEERDGSGEPRGLGVRALRLGRTDENPLGTAAGGTTATAPWGILLHRAGTLKYSDMLPDPQRADMDMSRDKPNAAGAFYEISGDAVLNLTGQVRFGDRDNGGSRTTPGAIFRVRGSNASIQVEDFINESRLGLWDHDNDHPAGITRMNLGKFVTEFVLDENGVSPIQINDELRMGRDETLDGNIEVGYAFLRLKLSAPTTAGSGELGSGDELVLFNFGRMTAGGDLQSIFGGEIGEGRFFDPDREGPNSAGTTNLPHAGLWDDGTVRADYAGAQYQWTINYFEGIGSAPTASLDDTIVLSGLTIDGTPGDLDGNGTLEAADRTLLVNTIASPPDIAIATAQNLFDLNADDVVDELDLAVFDAHFGLGGSSTIPEPSSLLLMWLTAMGWSIIRRRY